MPTLLINNIAIKGKNGFKKLGDNVLIMNCMCMNKGDELLRL